MKRIANHFVYAVLVITTLTHCDKVVSQLPELEEPELIELIAPDNESIEVTPSPKLVWKQLEDAKSYRIKISEYEGFETAVLDSTVGENFATITSLDEETKYYWKVYPIKEKRAGPWSPVWTFETGITPTVVQLLAPADDSDKISANVEFSWNSMADDGKYTFQLSDNSSFNSLLKQETINGTTFTPAELQHQKRYHWRVKVNDDEDGETWSDGWTFTTGVPGSDTGNSSVVGLLSPADNATNLSTSPLFEWEKASEGDQYEFHLSANSSFSDDLLRFVQDGTTYQADDLGFGKQYYWRVRVDGEQEWSSTRSFTTKYETVSQPPPPSSSFVQIHNSNFVRDGEIMRFAGTNAYYLPNYEKLDVNVVDRALNLFQDTGITVVRMWGFYDGYDCGYSKNDSNENVIQTSPGVYSESALRDLDNVIAKGKERGIGFIIPFINYWDELGGICQYNTWAGAENPSTNMEFFLSNRDTQKWYKAYIKMLLNRVNTVTGVAYKDEPAIIAWQIMNEGRNRGANPAVLRDWYQEIARYIKSIDSNHLVSTGEEGFDEGTPSVYSIAEYSNTYVLRANEGTSYVLNTAIPEIDFGSAHWYPNEFGFGININDNLLRAQRAWLSDHQKIAESHGKPFVMGEFGFPGWADNRVVEMYQELYEYAESIRLDGNLLWQLVADGAKCWEFGGNICYPAGRQDTELYYDFKKHVASLRNLK
ncbi:MAG: cellulase family glycosylhydrolase [Balneolales bacterium]|nr:cellulase family glycosylhydrolase [Balneolales bacterium]